MLSQLSVPLLFLPLVMGYVSTPLHEKRAPPICTTNTNPNPSTGAICGQTGKVSGGKVLKSTSVASQTQCRDLCLQKASCGSFSYASTKKCTLYKTHVKTSNFAPSSTPVTFWDASCYTRTCGCPTGQQNCYGDCVDTMTDKNNCGSCFTTCPGSNTCNSGSCTTNLNYLYSGDFETGTASGWTFLYPNDDPSVDTATSAMSSPGYQSQYSMRLACSSSNGAARVAMNQYVPGLVAGRNYSLSFYYNQDPGSNGYFVASLMNTGYNLFTGGNPDQNGNPAGAWAQHTHYWTASAGADVVELEANCLAGETAVYRVDNIVFTEVS